MKKTFNLQIKKTAIAALLLCLLFFQTGLAADELLPQTPAATPLLAQVVDLGSTSPSSTQTGLEQTIIIEPQPAGKDAGSGSTTAPLPDSHPDTPSGTPASGLDINNVNRDPGDASSTAPFTEQASSTPETTSLLPEDPAGEPATATSSADTASSTIEIINTNDVTVVNEADAKAVTGENGIQAENGGENAAINTGDINVYANVLNVLNTNLYNSEIIRIVENFNSLSADLLLNHPETSNAELAQDLASQICPDVACQSLSSFTLSNQNTAALGNDIDVSGNSGNNSVNNVEKDASIKTGDVKAVVNVLNIVNSNLINSRWTIATINVFGDFSGDLVLPSELYFQDYLTIGANTAAADLADIKKVVININNDNRATVVNNVNTDAQTGGNNISAGGASSGQGDLKDANIRTGDAQSASVVENYLNTNIFNGRWYLGIINTLGDWSGNIYSLPGQVAMAATPHGMTFFSTSANDPRALTMFEDTMDTAQNLEESSVNINNRNSAVIVNDVEVLADTGGNSIAAEDAENTGITTGNAYALANILNFANTNLVNSDLQVGLVNIFGRWNGNLVFGYPDLAVSQRLVSDKFPKERNATSAFEVTYSNPGPSSMLSSALKWQFDPAAASLLSVAPRIPYDYSADGTITFDLGKLPPKSSGKLEITLVNAKDLQEGAKFTAFARIYGLGPEQNKTNNESLLEVYAATTNAGGGSQAGQQNPGGGSGGSASSEIHIYKTNDAAWSPVPPGSKVGFTLTIDNDGANEIYNTLIYDVLRDPDGNIISSKKFTLGKMVPMEEAVIGYDIDIPYLAKPGEYVNTAYAEALDGQMRKITSANTAVSKFTVAGQGQILSSTGQPRELLKAPEDSGQTASAGLPKFPVGRVKSEKTVRDGTFSPLEAIAGVAEARPDANSAKSFDLTGQNASRSPLSRYLGWLLLIILVAAGYAGANLLARLKKSPQNGIAGAEIDSIDIPPMAALPLKRKRGRPKNPSRGMNNIL